MEGASSSSQDKGTLPGLKRSLNNMESIRAPRPYQPGDLIHQEEIFARVLPRDKKDKQCEFCHKSSDDLIYCNACSEVKYCDSECKRKDADHHSKECGKLDQLRGDAMEDLVRLLGRIIFIIKGKSWKDVRRSIMGSYVTFDDIDSHYEEMMSNQRLFLLCVGLKDGLREFIGHQNLPADDELIKIIGKVIFSSLDLSVNMPLELCFCVSMFQHECIPNANIEVCGNIVKIWAIKKIGKSDKITISRRCMLSSCLIRSPLNDNSLNVCKCTECSLPYGESVFTKILDKRKAYDAIRLSERAITISQTLSNFDLEEDFRLRILVDKALEKQVGVLGPTNALHLKLLAVKAMTLQGTDIQKKMYLQELERNMSLAFGDLYLELRNIYESLTVINFKLDNILEAALYLKKAERLKASETS